jgi:hypothetical protein
MSARVRLARDDDGRIEAVKPARDPADRAALAREARILAAIRHPGVVDLVELRDGPDGPELVTRWVGTRSLADLLPLPVDQAIGVVAALAATLADLHRDGIVHGAIEPTHVLLDGRGRPVLCSLARATVPTMVDARRPGTDDAPARPSDDVAALGDLLAASAGLPDDPELVPTRRFGRRRTNHLHRDVLTIADHARADDPTCRPSAAAVAHSLAELLPEAVLPELGSERSDEVPGSVAAVGTGDELEAQLQRLRSSASVVQPARRRWPLVAACGAVALVVFGVVAIVTTPAATPPTAFATASGSPSTSTTVDVVQTAIRQPSTTATTATPWATTGFAAATSPVVEIEGVRYEVGAPGDIVEVAPWRCDGRPRPLLLRPGTGDLFLFDDTARVGVESIARTFTTVVGATSLRPADTGDACPAASVIRADGSTTVVPLPPERG